MIVVDLSVTNAAAPPADELDYSFAASAGFAAPVGSFQAEAGAPTALFPVDHPAVSPGIHVGDLRDHGHRQHRDDQGYGSDVRTER